MGFVGGWRGGDGVGKLLLRVEEVQTLLDCSRRKVYDLVETGHLLAHHRDGRPGVRGMRIVARSVDVYVERGVIPAERFLEK